MSKLLRISLHRFSQSVGRLFRRTSHRENDRLLSVRLYGAQLARQYGRHKDDDRSIGHSICVVHFFTIWRDIFEGKLILIRKHRAETKKINYKLYLIPLIYKILQNSCNFVFFVLHAFSALCNEQGRYSLGGTEFTCCVGCYNRMVFAFRSKPFQTIPLG